MLSEVRVVIDGDIFYGGLNIDGYVIDFIFCVGVQFPCDFLGVVGAHGANDSAGLDLEYGNGYMEKFRKVCLPTRKETGLGLDPTFCGDFASLGVVSFSGESGLLVAFEALDSLFYRRCYARRPYSLARTFNELTACRCTRYATHGGIEKL